VTVIGVEGSRRDVKVGSPPVVHILCGSLFQLVCAVLQHDEILARFEDHLLWWWLMNIKTERVEVHSGKYTCDKMPQTVTVLLHDNTIQQEQHSCCESAKRNHSKFFYRSIKCDIQNCQEKKCLLVALVLPLSRNQSLFLSNKTGNGRLKI
jgi:hypothetical protein